MQHLKRPKYPFPQWCASFQLTNDWVVLDTETTGLFGEVLELAIIDHKGQTLYNGLIKPTCAIEEGASAVHGLTMEKLAFAPSWAQEWPRIRDILAGHEIVTYNARFDMDRILDSCKAHNIEMPQYTWHCLLTAYADFWQAPKKYNTYPYQALTKALSQQRLQPSNAHRALGDAQMAHQLLLHCGRDDAELNTYNGPYVEKKKA